MSQAVDLKTVGQQAIDLALELKADYCDVLGLRGNSFSLTAQGGAIDKYKVSSSNVLGIRVIKDQKVGLCYTEAMDPESVRQMVQQAVEVSKFSGVDEYQTIDVKEPEKIETKEKLYQPDDTPTEEKLAMALELESAVLGGGGHVKNSPYNGYGDGESEMIYLNHLGTYGYHRERSFSCYTSALTENDDRQAMYGVSMMGRKFQDLDPKYCADEALKYALPLLDGKAVATGKYDIIFSPDELDQIFSCFLSSFSAKAAMEGKNRFRDKVGSEVADSRLSLMDLPMYDQGFYYSSFDDEGVARRDLSLLKDGVLQSFYHNTATAKYFGTSTTAHGARSPKGALGVAGTQLVFAAGQDEEGTCHEGRYIQVIGLKGLHSGTNPISGQFSLAIDGILMNGDKVEQYVRDATISGNFFSLLNQVEAVSSKIHANSSKTFFAPTIRFGGVSVAGA
ncbi:TldD/PmbA family protein [Pseudobacteriovorax antillogorgiicola]|uniref:PmbA protein n=1 Tax=Pseudobacteriovorax antillogorgiicola TaxID=1513793 RepID=A0A1Y6BD78_9BACT|nr:TldD/PmbA family protein [Pseudobacteriovorax antillogorgiicola]TCS58530.1 PmbA protein [Pseudobacteriovorax antillogorgiicola]SME97895.1 PmbA protein [Pseudobacteriovorax antillogorgiicola]